MFLVIEIQKTSDTTVGNFVWSYVDRNEAESKFHSVLSQAAISNVPLHSAALLSDEGYTISCQSYSHVQETPEEEEMT